MKVKARSVLLEKSSWDSLYRPDFKGNTFNYHDFSFIIKSDSGPGAIIVTWKM